MHGECWNNYIVLLLIKVTYLQSFADLVLKQTLCYASIALHVKKMHCLLKLVIVMEMYYYCEESEWESEYNLDKLTCNLIILTRNFGFLPNILALEWLEIFGRKEKYKFLVP